MIVVENDLRLGRFLGHIEAVEIIGVQTVKAQASNSVTILMTSPLLVVERHFGLQGQDRAFGHPPRFHGIGMLAVGQ